MSHFTKVETKFTDTECLIQALTEVKTRTGGWTRAQIEVHAEPQSLYGYHGDRRAQKAEIVIRRQHVGGSSNDIGFYRQEDGTYGAHVSKFDTRSYGPEWMSALSQRYALATVRKNLPYGYSVVEETQTDGEIYVTVQASY